MLLSLVALALAADPAAEGITGGYLTTWVAADGPPTFTVQWVPGYRYDSDVLIHAGERTVAMLHYPEESAVSSPTTVEVTQVDPGFYPIHVQWSDDPRADLRFWAALGPGVDIRLVQPSGPQLAEAPRGLRCGIVAADVPKATWGLCENGRELAPGKAFSLDHCEKPPFSADRIYVKMARGDRVDRLHFVPSLPGLYVFGTNGSRVRASFRADYGTPDQVPQRCADLPATALDAAD